MGKIAFIFPGQGAQYQNMAREFYENFPESRFVFERASKAAGFSLEELCFMEGEKLNQTRYTQPALLTACCAILQAVKQTGILPDMTAGLSLGEYCALLAAGVMDLDQAVKGSVLPGRLYGRRGAGRKRSYAGGIKPQGTAV